MDRSPDSGFSVGGSSLESCLVPDRVNLLELALRRKLTIQDREMREHCWYRGQEAGHTVDPDQAALDYVINHGKRFSDVFDANAQNIYANCDTTCGVNYCRGISNCPLTNEQIHELLGD
ncbi:hypothetical protein COV20_00695 [Candidatus Woesearchaeota archaeon CG10_big_fil_rev_8_21_14_0_10_45_16]|nr:MAG: hypothetical protein COV20_00695 [Candidatus Woesearchaeota archaeon CG10_big_fil_rev_8_21_14_0_10_45_16]